MCLVFSNHQALVWAVSHVAHRVGWVGGKARAGVGGGHSMGLWVYWIGQEGRDASLQLACELDRLALGHARASLLRELEAPCAVRAGGGRATVVRCSSPSMSLTQGELGPLSVFGIVALVLTVDHAYHLGEHRPPRTRLRPIDPLGTGLRPLHTSHSNCCSFRRHTVNTDGSAS